jgi:hypothetical protein
MTDFNDGEIHAWNGGECPLHPKTRLEAREWNGGRWTADAEDCHWPSFKGAFRVVTPYVEPPKPLECWMIYIRGVRWATYTSLGDAQCDAERYPTARIVHMREVLP